MPQGRPHEQEPLAGCFGYCSLGINTKSISDRHCICWKRASPAVPSRKCITNIFTRHCRCPQIACRMPDSQHLIKTANAATNMALAYL
eukprot:scaffold252347_cov20-Tisochrysis_lutea.AAC.3